MTEERSCNNCGIDLICQECDMGYSKWQPIAQEKKTMEKIQMTEEQAYEICRIISGSNNWDEDLKRLKQAGYIRKSAVEEAEEYEKHFARIMDLGLSCTIKDLEYSMRIIERLKSEIARLKG